MIQTKATGHAGNKRRSDSAVAQQLTPANTRKRAAKTKRLNLFCSIISKQNEVRKTIQINSPLQIYIFSYPPNFINTYSETNLHITSYLRFIQQSENQNPQTTSQNEQFRWRFSLQPTTPGLTSSHLSCHLFTKYAPPAATLLEQPLSTLSHHRTLSEKQQKVKINSTILPLFPHTPNDNSPHIKRKTKIKAPDIENGHTATASRVILKNEKHVPHVSYINIYVGKKPRPSPIMRKKT